VSARLALYGLLWRAALAQVHPYAQRIFLGLALAGSMALAALAWGAYDAGTALRWGWNTFCVTILLTWTWGFVPGAFKLNTPAYAQLTPRMRARLLELGLLVWSLCIAGLAAGNAGHAVDVALRVVWLMAASLGMALAATGNGAGAVVLIALWPLMGLPSFVPEPVRVMMAEPGFLPLFAALLILPGLATMRAIFPRAGDRHWRLLSKTIAWRSKNTFGNHEGGGFMRWWQERALRRASRRHDLGAMLVHGSGPGVELGWIALGIGISGLFGIGMMALIHLSGHRKAAELAVQTGWIWSLLPLLLFQLHTMLLASMTDTSAGHPLLRLAPAMPATAPRFNRLLASTMLRSSLTAWAMAAATTILCAALSGAAAAEVLLAACLSGLALPALALPLRDHARRPRLNPVVQWLLVLALAGACLLVAVFIERILKLPIFPTAAGFSVVLTAVLTARRYRFMLKAPFAFPAGRLD